MAPHRLSERYRLESQIARGPVYSVWLAIDMTLRRAVILKMPHADLAADEDFRRRYAAAARSAAALVHPNIVAVYDTGEQHGIPFIVTEHLEGGSLADLLRADPLDPRAVATLGAQICLGLAHAHRSGIVHGDISPTNVLFTSRQQAKLSDFGLARAALPVEGPPTPPAIEASPYQAPEAAAGAPIDPRADVFSLGAVLYECATHRLPFPRGIDAAPLGVTPRPPSDLRPGIPRALDAVIMRALAPLPRDRFGSAEEMGAVLAQLAEGYRGEITPPPRGRPARADASFFRSEGRWLAPTMLVVVLAAALVLGVVALIRRTVAGGDSEGPASPRIAVISGGTYDPQGDHAENDDLVSRAFDGDEGTFWRTDGYSTERFGALKDGLGIWFDLGENRPVRRIRVVSIAGGWEAAIRFADSAPQGPGWSPPGASTEAGRVHEFSADGAHRYWMIWITRLVHSGAGEHPFSVSVAEVEFSS